MVAHPRKINAGKLREATLAANVDGFEVFYEGQEEMQAELLDIVKQRDLVATGGSDWHGYFRGPYPGWSMPRESVNRLLERLGLSPL